MYHSFLIHSSADGHLGCLTKEARIYNGAKTTFSINGTGKTGHLHLNNAIRTLPNTIHKDKMVKDLNVRPETINSYWKT